MTDGSTPVPSSTYAFEQPGQPADARFDALSALYDESTQRHLAARGVGPGWCCLEVGAGGGSIARWLAEEVGADGHVVATDLNTDHLEHIRSANLEILRHDIRSDSLPDASFDLVHTRLVLVHLAERERVLQRLIAALKPGGWMVLEEFDARSMLPDASVNPAETELRLIPAIQQGLANHGADTRFGRLLPGRLRALGLGDVGAEGRVLLWEGGSVWARLHQTNALRLRSEIVSSGLLTDEEFDHELSRLDDPEVMAPSAIMWTVWGRRPAE